MSSTVLSEMSKLPIQGTRPGYLAPCAVQTDELGRGYGSSFSGGWYLSSGLSPPACSLQPVTVSGAGYLHKSFPLQTQPR